MKFLILSAILTCVAAAPSGTVVGPIAPVGIPAIPIPAIKTLPSPVVPAIPIVGVKTIAAIPVAAPTISPGDIQAAAINAKVEAEDALRAAIDKNREMNEQALKEQADKIIEASNMNEEKGQEKFWEVEDKKWQVLTALQTAQAKIDGIVASNAELLGKTVLQPNAIAPGIVPIAPGLTPISPYVFGTVAIKDGEKKDNKEEQKMQEMKAEEVKTQELKSEDVSQDSVQIESADSNDQAAVRTPAAVAENEQKMATGTSEPKVKDAGIVTPVVANLGFPLYAPIAGLPVNLNEVGWPALLPGVKILTPGLTVAPAGLVTSVAGK